MNNYLEFFLKAYPDIVRVILFILYLIYGNNEFLYVFALTILSKFLNYSLKNFLFKPVLKSNTYPIIGRGKRPNGAYNCGAFDIGKKKVKSKTYGMPSGHSQTSSLISTYLIYKLMDIEINQPLKIILYIIAIVVPLSVMYSRYIFKCHTKQQIFLGALIGYLSAKQAYFSKNIFKNYLE